MNFPILVAEFVNFALHGSCARNGEFHVGDEIFAEFLGNTRAFQHF